MDFIDLKTQYAALRDESSASNRSFSADSLATRSRQPVSCLGSGGANACRDNCVAKYPRRTGGAGASIGSTLPTYSNSQRAALIASCRKDCMAGYPLCK